MKEIVKKAEIATNCEGIFCLQFEFESGRAWYTTLEEENMFKILKVFFSWCHCLNSYAGKTIELRDWELIFLGTHFKDGILEFDVIKDSKSEHMCATIEKEIIIFLILHIYKITFDFDFLLKLYIFQIIMRYINLL